MNWAQSGDPSLIIGSIGTLLICGGGGPMKKSWAVALPSSRSNAKISVMLKKKFSGITRTQADLYANQTLISMPINAADLRLLSGRSMTDHIELFTLCSLVDLTEGIRMFKNGYYRLAFNSIYSTCLQRADFEIVATFGIL
jgi:hypothetical protein